MKYTDKLQSQSHRTLIYGSPKSGKTLMTAKLAEKYNLLWFDIENGSSTLAQLPRQWQERVELISLPDSRVFPIAIETLMKVITGKETFICEAHGKCLCALCRKDKAAETRVCLNEIAQNTVVVFDSLTQLTNSAISHITRNQPDDYKLDYADWGNLAILMDKFLSQVQVARYNVVCITHEAEVELEDGKTKLVPVCGSTKSSRNTAKYFDHVVYSEIRNKKHIAGSGTGYSNSAVTGSRTGVELEKNKDNIPNLLDIYTLNPSQQSDKTVSVVPVSVVPVSVVPVSDKTVVVIPMSVVPEVVYPTPSIVKVEEPLSPGQVALANLRAKMAKGG